MSRLRDRIRERRGRLAGAVGAGPTATPDSPLRSSLRGRPTRNAPTRRWREDASRVRPAVLNEVEFIPAEGMTEEDIARERKALEDHGVKVRVSDRRGAIGMIEDSFLPRENPLSAHPEILSATVRGERGGEVTFIVDPDAEIDVLATTEVAHELARHHGLERTPATVRIVKAKR